MLRWFVEPWSIVLFALGGVILGCVVAIGLDARRARRHGPRWGRRALAGAVAVVAVVGVYFAAKRHPMNNPPPIMCYAPMIQPPPPSQPSPAMQLRKLQSRLDLLQRLGREGHLRPDVIDLRLAALREELASSVQPHYVGVGHDLTIARRAGLLAAVEKELS
jgi:hypothetical protein